MFRCARLYSSTSSKEFVCFTVHPAVSMEVKQRKTLQQEFLKTTWGLSTLKHAQHTPSCIWYRSASTITAHLGDADADARTSRKTRENSRCSTNITSQYYHSGMKYTKIVQRSSLVSHSIPKQSVSSEMRLGFVSS